MPIEINFYCHAIHKLSSLSLALSSMTAFEESFGSEFYKQKFTFQISTHKISLKLIQMKIVCTFFSITQFPSCTQ